VKIYERNFNPLSASVFLKIVTLAKMYQIFKQQYLKK